MFGQMTTFVFRLFTFVALAADTSGHTETKPDEKAKSRANSCMIWIRVNKLLEVKSLKAFSSFFRLPL